MVSGRSSFEIVQKALVPWVFDCYTKLYFSPAHKIHKIHALRIVSAISSLSSFFCYMALVARIPIVAGVSAASNLAVELAQSCGMALVGFVRGSSLNVYTGSDRIAL